MNTKTIQIRKRGTITLPAALREKYRLAEGDAISVIDMGEGVFLSPRRTLLPKLAREIEKLREAYGVSAEELIQGVAEERRKYGAR
ncbi:MAG: AbrB/MazE/SpoVT family DNA-binding domain-containing protein [Deltaproteobacteria bacterium]|nr:AbrB/MazE/SpoVT family DNA-binding domain-containing protein [Deltaproteobacteria bacterium]MBW2602586.1 AbrB/MazE/SpoVT family DNA-binding domain-containing protein [Deltaproteobacteria bacterium]